MGDRLPSMLAYGTSLAVAGFGKLTVQDVATIVGAVGVIATVATNAWHKYHDIKLRRQQLRQQRGL